LWGWTVEHSGAIEAADLQKNGTGFFGTAPTHSCKNALNIAATQIGRYPDPGFQPHSASVA
jgi:hypothetical protein